VRAINLDRLPERDAVVPAENSGLVGDMAAADGRQIAR
jgi:hypothetical protein